MDSMAEMIVCIASGFLSLFGGSRLGYIHGYLWDVWSAGLRMYVSGYGAHYGMLMLVDTLAFAWHGNRPMWWKREFVQHRFASPMLHCSSVPSEQDLEALREAQKLYPGRIVYLALGSEYSPWVGTRFFHHVKVLVGDRDGSLPSHPANGYGISLEKFRRLEVGRDKGLTQERVFSD